MEIDGNRWKYRKYDQIHWKIMENYRKIPDLYFKIKTWRKGAWLLRHKCVTFDLLWKAFWLQVGSYFQPAWVEQKRFRSARDQECQRRQTSVPEGLFDYLIRISRWTAVPLWSRVSRAVLQRHTMRTDTDWRDPNVPLWSIRTTVSGCNTRVWSTIKTLMALRLPATLPWCRRLAMTAAATTRSMFRPRSAKIPYGNSSATFGAHPVFNVQSM